MIQRLLVATAAVALLAGPAVGPAAAQPRNANQDIIQTAQSNGSFTTLLTAVRKAGLQGTLKTGGPFTVFAPTDEAFAKLPEGTVENLLKPENKEQLVALLTYHVVPGKTMSSDLAGKAVEAKTVEGSPVEIDATGSGVMVDDARVIQADVEADNGVIHVIDAVIMPKM